MIILFKYCADVKNCGSFKSFGFIYIYIDNKREESAGREERKKK